MNIPVMCKLVYVLAVNLQLLSSYCIFRSAILAARLRCLYAARAQRVEEAVLAFGGVRGEGGCWSGILFLEIVPLPLSALYYRPKLPTYLYARVLCS
jgi:hypothetical protein